MGVHGGGGSELSSIQSWYTCEGLYKSSPTSFDILAITNSVPGNGHFEDVLEWFYNSCRRDQKDLVILEVWNSELKRHLIHKRKFKPYRVDDVILKFKNIPSPPKQ